MFFFSSRRRHTRLQGDWSSDVCSSDLELAQGERSHHALTGLGQIAGLEEGRGELEIGRGIVEHQLAHARPRLPIQRSEEHTSELQSPCNLVCRLLLEKKKK